MNHLMNRLEQWQTRREIKEATEMNMMNQRVIDQLGLTGVELVEAYRESWNGRYKAALLQGSLSRPERMRARIALFRLEVATGGGMHFLQIVAAAFVAIIAAMWTVAALPPAWQTGNVFLGLIPLITLGFVAPLQVVRRLEEIRAAAALQSVLDPATPGSPPAAGHGTGDSR